MTITLYQFGNSVCCQKVRVTLHYKGLAWTPVEVNLFKNEQYEPEYLKLNRAGVVPTMVDGDDIVTESTLICDYLDERYPDPPLMPASPGGRARARFWAKLVDEGLHEGVSEISFSAMFRQRMKQMTDAQREQRFANIGDPKRRDRFTSTYQLGARSPFVAHGVAAFERAFALLEDSLSHGGPWIMGAAPTLADVALMPYVARLEFLGLLDLWAADHPRVGAWWRLACGWPSFRAGIEAPMLDQERAEMALHGPAIRSDIADVLVGLRGTGTAT